ncbi:MAG: redox-sensing transcriptional repressor Rex [Planctomycetota bacterium]|nr:redox-sensing transcriptional repressor Rex [Planctomycetota bacterium]
MKTTRLPRPSVERLCTYLRELTRLSAKRMETIRSRELAKRVGVSADQIRRDFWLIGSFGKRGHGYDVEGLRKSVAAAIGLEKEWSFIVVGVGNLGTSVLNYKTLLLRGFKACAAFDKDGAKIGKKVGGVKIQHVSALPRVIASKRPALAVLAVPASAAQETADRLFRLGIKGILNLAPTDIFAPAGTRVRNADMSREIEALAVAVKMTELAR